ncbi:MAG: heavy metal-binding domain-containing protein, partial [Acidobacteriota bacterium]
FCAVSCRDRFAADPDKYLTKPDQSAGRSHEMNDPANDEVEYTCPMHPEIVQIGPGSCPICGMALEPKEISLNDAPDPEFTDMRRRFWVAAALTVPIFVAAMS